MAPFRFIKWALEGTPIQIFGDGEQGRDFTFVSDIADGTLRALRPVGFEIINLGGGKSPTTVNKIIDMIELLANRKVKRNYLSPQKTDMQDTHADISKAAELLDWAPRVDLTEGMRQAVKWHTENQDLVKNIDVNQ
jgi:nucleoside-diphosphate-sugar epimerase